MRGCGEGAVPNLDIARDAGVAPPPSTARKAHIHHPACPAGFGTATCPARRRGARR